ncbi:18994_t:CDS:2, partial [Racocetra fulgida]
IKAYLEKTCPAKASYNDFVHKNKASLAKQSNYEPCLIRNSQLKKQFILSARELRYDEKFIKKGDLKELRRGSRAITRSMGWLKKQNYNNDNQRDFNDDDDTYFSDNEDESIQDNSEETITNVLSLSNEVIYINIQKTIEEGWKVSSAKKLVDKYYEAIVNHFDETSDVDHEMLITASELCYHSEIVNSLFAGTFEMIERSVWLEIGEIENEIQKMQRNDTKKDNERSKLGMKHDGVAGNAFNNDITNRNIDLEKLYK